MKQIRRMTLRTVIFLLLFVFGQILQAATIMVDTPEDKFNEGEFIPDDDLCSLREAIFSANENRSVGGCEAGDSDSPDEIIFADNVTPGTFTLSIEGREEDSARRGDLDIRSDLTITGRGASQTIIDGGNIDRVLHILGAQLDILPKVIISGVTIQNGTIQTTGKIPFPFLGTIQTTDKIPFPFGGGIANSGELMLESSIIQNNTASLGGGVYNQRLLTINSSIIQNNTASSGGGGVYNQGSLTINSSTIKKNTAELAGGGIVNLSVNLLIKSSTISDNQVNNSENGVGGGIVSTESAELINSTVSGNSAFRGAGIFFSQGMITLTHTTIANNNASIGGGLSIDGIAELRNTIITNNKGGDCEVSITSTGGNLDSDGSCGLDPAVDLSATNPLLGPLQDNEGLTFTHALLPNSPAINAISGDCTDQSGNVIDIDQRGITRSQGNGCDIGAFEAKAMADLAISITSSPERVLAGDNLSYSLIIRNTGPDDATDVSIVHTLPFGVIYQSTLSSPECIESTPETISCNLDTIAVAPDQPTTLQIVVSPSLRLSDEINTTTTISSTLTDSDLKNNSDTTQTDVIQLPPAATIEVNTTDDKFNDSSIILAGELCSLREAIVAANEDRPVGGCTTGNGADEITFADEVTPGTFVLSISGAPSVDEDLTRSGDLDIFSELTIQGNGRSQTIIDAAQIDRVFHVIDPANGSPLDSSLSKVIISGVSIQNGSPLSLDSTATLGGGIANSSQFPVLVKNSIILNNMASLGGGVYNDGTLTVDNCTIENNNGTFGGGLFNNNSLTVDRSTVTNNAADSDGGGISNSGNEFTLTASTISNNLAADSGGGMTNFGSAELVNSTLSSNEAARGGAIFDGEGDITVSNTTIANNIALTGGGLLVSGTANLKNSIVSGNTGGDCATEIISSGGNLDSDGSCGLNLTVVDLPATDPLLGSLQLNGGLTFTHALLQGSPAIDAITGICSDQSGNRIIIDQRGVERPQSLDGKCDIGAYEARIFSADLSILMEANPDPVFAGNNLTYAITVQNSGPDDANNVSITNTLPANVAYQASLSSSECIASTSATITCDLGTIRVDDLPVRMVQIIVTPSAGVSSEITNSAIVSAIEFDPETNNNRDITETEVIPREANLSITKSITRINNSSVNSTENTAVLGSVLQYTLVIRNDGPNDANEITINDEYQRFIEQSTEALNVAVVSIEFVDMDPLISNCKQVDPGAIFSCRIATLAVNQEVSMTIGVKPIGAGTLVNTTRVTANELDPEPENDIAILPTQITPPQQLTSASRFIPSVFDFPDNLELAYVLIGSPLNLQMPQASSVLQTFGPIAHDDLWRLFRFNSDAGKYDIFAAENNEFNFLPHRGFWLIVRNGKTLTVSGTPNDATVPYTVQLKAGLQQISTPFNFPPGFLIDWNQCVVPFSSGISRDLFDFEGLSGGYVKREFMQPMHAYWVFADTAMTLAIPPDCVTLVDNEGSESIQSIQPKARVARSTASAAAVKWRVKLSVNIGALTDSDNFIGADSAAIDAYDALDIPEPPAFHSLSLSFPHPEWDKPWTDYAADIRMIKSATTTWDFTVTTDVFDTPITLQWNLSGICLEAFTLRDVDANRIINMGDAKGYDFNNHARVRHFEITANWRSCL